MGFVLWYELFLIFFNSKYFWGVMVYISQVTEHTINV